MVRTYVDTVLVEQYSVPHKIDFFMLEYLRCTILFSLVDDCFVTFHDGKFCDRTFWSGRFKMERFKTLHFVVKHIIEGLFVMEHFVCAAVSWWDVSRQEYASWDVLRWDFFYLYVSLTIEK